MKHQTMQSSSFPWTSAKHPLVCGLITGILAQRRDVLEQVSPVVNIEGDYTSSIDVWAEGKRFRVIIAEVE